MSSEFNIRDYKAVIFDLDGVITQTASLHAKAWKQMFHEFLDQWMEKKNTSVEQIHIDEDYPEYIDGKPRYDGVRSFLESRDIELPEGSPDDPPGKWTIGGLGNRKNDLFHEQLEKEGVHVFDDTVEFIKTWKDRGVKIAVISSSKNCKSILQNAGILDLFDARVDGVIAEQRNLDGKPAPDVFLNAAQEMNVKPSDAVIVEDARAGIQAGKNGNFGFLIGIARNIDADELYAEGADLVVDTLGDLREKTPQKSEPESLPSALANFEDIKSALHNRELALFLDYDGTLSPIVSRPENATMREEMRRVVKQLAQQCTVAIVSGRERRDVEEFVRLDELIYAGSHGFDIQGPSGLELQHQKGEEALPALETAGKKLKKELQDIDGAQIERKRYAIAVHFRNVSDDSNVEDIEKMVDQIAEDHPELKTASGKKIIELKPDIDWDKGKALLWLLDNLHIDTDRVIPMYIGDDLTDEDAFRVLVDNGFGVLVGEHGEQTLAKYHLNDVDEVQTFLGKLVEILKEASE